MSSESKRLQAMDPNAKLSFIERVAYGMGDYAGNLVYSAISAFLLVYYTEVLGVAAATAASIMAVSKIFDGVSDLIMGRIVDNTKSKYGKARPWIIRMSIPLAVCTVLMFSVPRSLAGPAQVGYMFISYNLVSTVFYTGLNVPYATLQGLMTTNQYERGLLGNFRMLLATFGTMTINSVVRPMCTFFGGGEFASQWGWTVTFVILMAAFLVINFFTFACCKERVVQDAITYGQWKTNVAAAGMGNAASSFCMKIGSGIGTSALGWILTAGGFDVDPYSAGSIAAINVAVIWVPVIVCVIGMVCLLLMDIDKHYAKVVEDLANGRWAGSDK